VEPTPFAAWETFYVIVGSAAAALTGLQFVVIALVADAQRERRLKDVGSGLDAFGTPNIVHFCAVLFFSAALNMPWRSLLPVALVFSTCGFAGIVYVIIVIRRANSQQSYQPVLEDWIWHMVLPLLAYGGLVVAAALLSMRTTTALFIIASTSLLLLFCGIHNAWDTVTYLAVDQIGGESKDPVPPEK
jgi:hypothetical protein